MGIGCVSTHGLSWGHGAQTRLGFAAYREAVINGDKFKCFLARQTGIYYQIRGGCADAVWFTELFENTNIGRYYFAHRVFRYVYLVLL